MCIRDRVWGGPSALRFSLDRTDIWDRSTPMYTEREDFTYANLVKLAKDGKTGEIREFFDAPYQCPTPTKLPSGKLIFCFSDGDHVCSELDLETAEAKFAIVSEKGTSIAEAAIVESFCHAVTKTGMIRVSASADSFRVKLEHPDFGRPEEMCIRDRFSREGLRVLGFAYKEVPADLELTVDHEDGLIFLGLIDMMDPPREESKAAVEECKLSLIHI